MATKQLAKFNIELADDTDVNGLMQELIRRKRRNSDLDRELRESRARIAEITAILYPLAIAEGDTNPKGDPRLERGIASVYFKPVTRHFMSWQQFVADHGEDLAEAYTTHTTTVQAYANGDGARK